MNLLIIGAGGHGKVVKEVAEAVGHFEKIDFVDDNSELAIGKLADLEYLRSDYEAAFVGIGNNQVRKSVLTELQGYEYYIPTLIHPTAYVSSSADIAYGTIIEPKAIVNAGAICKAGSVISAGVKLEASQVVKGY